MPGGKAALAIRKRLIIPAVAAQLNGATRCASRQNSVCSSVQRNGAHPFGQQTDGALLAISSTSSSSRRAEGCRSRVWREAPETANTTRRTAQSSRLAASVVRCGRFAVLVSFEMIRSIADGQHITC